MVAAVGAQKRTLQHLYVVSIVAGPRYAVTILLQVKYLKGELAIDPGDTQTLTTVKKDLHQEHSGAGIVGEHAIAMTTFAPGAVVLITIKVTTT